MSVYCIPNNCEAPVLRAEIKRMQHEWAVVCNEYGLLRAENERLRTGVRNYLSGDYGPRIKKMEKCPHGQYGYEICEACIDKHFADLLSDEQKASDPDEGLPTAKDVRGILKPPL